MMRTPLILTLIALLIPAALAQGVFNLTPEEIAALPPLASENYQAAIGAFGDQRYAEGFAHLRRAGEAAPDSVKLQFILGQISTNIARHLRTENTIAVAQQAYNRIISHAQATEADHTRARDLLTALGAIPDEIEANASEEAQARAQAEHIRLLRERLAERSADQARAAREAAEQANQAAPAEQPANVTPATAVRRDMMAIQDARDERDMLNNR